MVNYNLHAPAGFRLDFLDTEDCGLANGPCCIRVVSALYPRARGLVAACKHDFVYAKSCGSFLKPQPHDILARQPHIEPRPEKFVVGPPQLATLTVGSVTATAPNKAAPQTSINLSDSPFHFQKVKGFGQTHVQICRTVAHFTIASS